MMSRCQCTDRRVALNTTQSFLVTHFSCLVFSKLRDLVETGTVEEEEDEKKDDSEAEFGQDVIN